MKPELISFKLCPFVQRSVITLLEKGADFDITYIDLGNPPEWFREISPLGKVPVMRVGDAVLFESAVIMEYLDEVNPPSLHPADPLRKAQNRAWIEVASTLFMNLFQMLTAKEETAFEEQRQALREKLDRVAGQVAGPFFNADQFQLIDAAWAPLFMRLNLLEEWCHLDLLAGLGQMQSWSGRLLERPAVQNSVVETFPDLFRGQLERNGGYLAGRLE